MRYNSTIGLKVQGQIRRFSNKISKGLSKPKRKFIGQVLFGIQASRDTKLSNISRGLNEEIKLIKTEQRLSRHMMSKDLTESINKTLIEDGMLRIKKDTVLAFDLSDVQKPFAKKMENLAKVWDGSEGKVGQGYWLSEVVGADVNEEHIIPLYSELYSQEAKDFESENEQILKAIRTVNEQAKGKGIWAIDRGGDRRILVREFDKMGIRFVIRARGDRHVKTSRGKEKKVVEIANRVKCKTRYKIKIDKEGYQEEKEIQLGVRCGLKMEGVKIRLVVVRGFGKKPLMLITNVEKTEKEILDIYLTRWKCEESFRFLKQEYHLEDVRTRTYTALRNMIVLVHAVFYFLSVYLGRRLRMNILIDKIIAKAKRFFEVPVFKHYAIADGIYRILFNRKWDTSKIQDPQDDTQLSFGFT